MSMQNEESVRIAIKNFAMEAERFKLEDLARLLNQPLKIVIKILKSMIADGTLQGVFTSKNDEFVTTERLKTEIIRVLKNPRILDHSL